MLFLHLVNTFPRTLLKSNLHLNASYSSQLTGIRRWSLISFHDPRFSKAQQHLQKTLHTKVEKFNIKALIWQLTQIARFSLESLAYGSHAVSELCGRPRRPGYNRPRDGCLESETGWMWSSGPHLTRARGFKLSPLDRGLAKLFQGPSNV